MCTAKQSEGVTAKSFQLLRSLLCHEINRAIGLATVTVADNARPGQLVEPGAELRKGLLDSLNLLAEDFVLRSEEHTSELQSRLHLVCRLLLEKKKKNKHKSSSIEQLCIL